MASSSFIDGKWRALVRIKGHKPVSKRFDTKAKADRWGKLKEAELLASGTAKARPRATVADLIVAYRKLRSRTRPISDQSTEHYTLKKLDAYLGHMVAADVSVEDLVAFALRRRDDGAGPYTVNMDLSRLGTVIRYAGDGVPDIVSPARPKLVYLGLIGGGGMRERRPTQEEYDLLLAHFDVKHGRRYADALAFAAVTAMRRGEVCALRFADIEEQGRVARVLRKHPRKGKTLELVPLLGEAWGIVMDQPRDGELVFPIHPQTLSKYFREACRELSIPDLHLHDFRHEGTSAMFEAGYPIEQVALVTGHKSWTNLRRYTQLKPQQLAGSRPDAEPRLGSRRIGGRRGTSAP